MDKKQLLEMSKEESMQFEKDYEKFSIIQKQNNFKTQWCLYEVKDINENSGLSADILKDAYYKNIEVILPNRKLNWLELWKYCDMLYETIGDSDHMFIEEFEVKKVKGKRELQVFFGS